MNTLLTMLVLMVLGAFASVFLAYKKILVQVCFVLAFLPFLRLSAWGSGFNNLSSFDAVSAGKMGVRLFTFSILAVYLLSKIRSYRREFGSAIMAFFVFFVFAGVSIIYSSSAFYSAYRLVEHVGFLLFVMTILILQRGEVNTGKAIDLVLYGCGSLVVVVWVTYFVAPSYAFRILGGSIATLGGHMMHIHTLGIISATIYGVVLYRFLGATSSDKVRILYFAIIGITFLTVVLTRSRTSFVIVSLLTGMVVLRTSSYKTGLIMALALLIIPFYDDRIFAAAADYLSRDQSEASLMSLSSRKFIWESIVSDVFKNKLVLGYGYQMMSERGLEFYSTEYHFTRTNAHNTFVQTFAGLGLIGVLLLVLQICRTSIDLYRINSKKYFERSQNPFELLILFVSCMVASTMQYGIVGMTTPIVPIYMVTVVYASYWARKTKQVSVSSVYRSSVAPVAKW